MSRLGLSSETMILFLLIFIIGFVILSVITIKHSGLKGLKAGFIAALLISFTGILGWMFMGGYL